MDKNNKNGNDGYNSHYREENEEIREIDGIRRGLEEYLDKELKDMELEETSYREPDEKEDGAYDWDEEEPEDEEDGREDAGQTTGEMSGRQGQHRSREPRNRNAQRSAKKGSGGRSLRTRGMEDEEDYGWDDEEEDPGEENPEDDEPVRRREKTKQKKKKKKRHFGWLKFLLVLVLLLLLLYFLIYSLVGKIYAKMTYEESETLMEEGSLKEDGVYSVLLIGSDSRDESTDGRSDAMILVTISTRTKTIHLTSLLRDMYVEIPGYEDGNRLNAAYAYGGAELLLETINQNFDLQVYRYAVANFEAFANVVDAVGGVDVEVTNEEVQWINAYLNEYNELRGVDLTTDYLDTSLSGTLHLNGAQALAYCRNRYIGTDFARTQRQRTVLSAVIKQLPSALLSDPSGLVDGLFSNLTTNLTQEECTVLLTLAPTLLTYEIEQDSLPLEGTYTDATIRSMSVLEVDFEANIAYLKEEIYGE